MISDAQLNQLGRFEGDNGDVRDFLMAVRRFNRNGTLPSNMETIAWVLFNWVLDSTRYKARDILPDDEE